MDFYLQRALQIIESATRGLTLEQLREHPAGKWCAAEIVEHLSRTFSATAKGLGRCLEANHPTARQPSLRDRLVTLVVVEIGYLPSGRQAPEYARPRGLPPESVLDNVRANIAVMDKTIAECERRFGNSVRIADHPILGPLTTRQWRRFHWVHTRHHMKQMARLRLTARGSA